MFLSIDPAEIESLIAPIVLIYGIKRYDAVNDLIH